MNKIVTIIFISILTMSCSSDSITNESKTQEEAKKNNARIEIDSNYIKFYDDSGVLQTTFSAIGSYHSEFNIISSYVLRMNAANIFMNASASDIFFTSETGDIFLNTGRGYTFINNLSVDSLGIVRATGYESSSGAVGKTYTEEYEDKQGNMRTKKYENGLLVSYKINGVEQY